MHNTFMRNSAAIVSLCLALNTASQAAIAYSPQASPAATRDARRTSVWVQDQALQHALIYGARMPLLADAVKYRKRAVPSTRGDAGATGEMDLTRAIARSASIARLSDRWKWLGIPTLAWVEEAWHLAWLALGAGWPEALKQVSGLYRGRVTFPDHVSAGIKIISLTTGWFVTLTVGLAPFALSSADSDHPIAYLAARVIGGLTLLRAAADWTMRLDPDHEWQQAKRIYYAHLLKPSTRPAPGPLSLPLEVIKQRASRQRLMLAMSRHMSQFIDDPSPENHRLAWPIRELLSQAGMNLTSVDLEERMADDEMRHGRWEDQYIGEKTRALIGKEKQLQAQIVAIRPRSGHIEGLTGYRQADHEAEWLDALRGRMKMERTKLETLLAESVALDSSGEIAPEEKSAARKRWENQYVQALIDLNSVMSVYARSFVVPSTGHAKVPSESPLWLGMDLTSRMQTLINFFEAVEDPHPLRRKLTEIEKANTTLQLQIQNLQTLSKKPVAKKTIEALLQQNLAKWADILPPPLLEFEAFASRQPAAERRGPSQLLWEEAIAVSRQIRLLLTNRELRAPLHSLRSAMPLNLQRIDPLIGRVKLQYEHESSRDTFDEGAMFQAVYHLMKNARLKGAREFTIRFVRKNDRLYVQINHDARPGAQPPVNQQAESDWQWNRAARAVRRAGGRIRANRPEFILPLAAAEPQPEPDRPTLHHRRLSISA